ncbi:MAG: tetratricopeptide repeat protein, partial [Halioglobus sp.]|nr:tetratricopeptide repeat protein [Halioglobus sp.]
MNRTMSCLLALLLVCSAGAFAQSEGAYYEQGVQAYAEGEYAEAYIHLKNALQADPNMVSARLLLAKVHFNAGNVHGAAKESEEALLLGADINLVLPVYGPALIVLRQTDKLFELEKVADEFTPETQFEWALLKGQGYLQRSEPDLARREFERAAEKFPNDVRSNNTLAALYIDNGMLEEAAGLLEKSLLLDANNVKTLELSAELAIAEEHYDKALRLLNAAYEQDSADLRVLRSLARVHLLQGNEQEMERYLELILEQSPDDPAATLLIAITSIDRGDTEIGDAMLSELSQKLSRVDALRLQTTDGMLFIQAASDYVRGSDRSAIDLFNTYLARNPSDLAAISMLVDLYLRNGESRRANTLLSDSREFITNDLALSLQLLHLYIQNGSVLNARELLEDLRKSTDDNPFVTILEAELERSQGRPAEALAVLDSRDFADDPPLSAGLLRGALLLDLGRLEEAREVASGLQLSAADELRVQNFAAIVYLRSGRLKDAERAVNAALKLSPSDQEARFSQAMLLKQRGKREEAARLLNEILEDRPSHTKSILLMAQILFEQGRSEEAIDWSKKVYVYDKTSTLPDEFQVGVYAQQGDWEEALTAALALSKADPLSDVYLVQLAEIYLRLGDLEVAQRPLRRLFVLWKDDPAKLRRLADLQIAAQNPAEARLTLEAALKLEPES